jgi:flagellar hook-associated protein 3 FlgL
MTISTSLFFSKAVSLMSQNQTDLATMQEKVATGKEIVRASDGVDKALNISRLKAGMSKLEAYETSLNMVGDRLKIEESYLQGTADTLTEIKTLVIQGANANYSTADREVIALQINELVNEVQSLANGTDANGNYLFGGTRTKTQPYVKDSTGVVRYQGDQVETAVNFTDTRQSEIGRSGPDIYQSVFSGKQLNVVEGIYDVDIGSVSVGDVLTLTIDGETIEYTAVSGDNAYSVAQHFYDQIQNKIELKRFEEFSVSLDGTSIQMVAADGVAREISQSSIKSVGGTAGLSVEVTPTQAPDPGRPERIEFFEALSETVARMRLGTQDEIQETLAYIDQMIDQSTLGLADIGVERGAIEAEIELNGDLRATLKASLSSEEDLDYATAITELQAKMMALEAAQSSFAKISNLSVFNFLR